MNAAAKRAGMPTEGDALDHADKVLATFEDATPQGAGAVAAETGLDVETVRATLAALVERDALCHKEVRGQDEPEQRLTSEELDALAVDLWYLPPERLAGGTVNLVVDDGGDIEDALDDLTFPGASDLMREWRRDAVRAAYEYLREREPVDTDGLREDVYPAHQAGYASDDAWWDCIEPRLGELPGVEHEDGTWRIVD